jgi:hypothetical protein
MNGISKFAILKEKSFGWCLTSFRMVFDDFFSANMDDEVVICHRLGCRVLVVD